MDFWQYSVLFFAVFLGGGIAIFLKFYQKVILSLILSFSGAYILGITVLHLMPAVFFKQSTTVGLCILSGFLVQLLLEQLSSGIEHGHIHAHQHASAGFAVQIMIGLCIHAFIEGIPLSNYVDFLASNHHAAHNHNHLFWGIILHKAPAAFALVFLLKMSGFSRKIVLLCLFLFAAMSPIGALISEWIAFPAHYATYALAVVIGSFLHIATTILFETDETKHHSISFKKLGVILAGIGLALLTI